jgi:serine/threonine-protein phosphatase 5
VTTKIYLSLFKKKIFFMNLIKLSKGNHESSIVNAKHGFMKEVGEKYVGDPFLFEFFGEIFRWMPVAHVIEDKILVVHGGISAAPSLTLDDISNLK